MVKKRLFTGKLNLELKKQIIKCLVWSIALCAAETWTLTQGDRSRLEDFEMWIWRRMEKISWNNKKTRKSYMWLEVENNLSGYKVVYSMNMSRFYVLQ